MSNPGQGKEGEVGMGFGFAALDRSRSSLGGKGFRAGDGPEILKDGLCSRPW